MVVGWSLPDANSDEGFTAEEVHAIKHSRTTMYLTIIDHSFDIKEDGSVDFKIEYRAYIEGAFTSPEANILVTQAALARQREREQAMAAMREDLSSPSGSCTQEDMAELRRRITNSIQLDKNDAHVALIEGLESNKGPGNSRIFLYSVTAGEMVTFLRSPTVAGSTDWSTYTDPTVDDANAGAGTTVTADLGQGTTGVAAQLRRDINFPAAVNFNSSSAPVDELMSNVYTQPVSGEMRIPYFFLGDLVHTALENINKVDSQVAASGSSGPTPPRKFEKMRLLLGPCEISEPNTGDVMQINLADIPISVNYFMEWFLERIQAKSEAKWFIVDFIKDVTRNLVLRVLQSEDCFNGAYRQRSQFQNLYLVGSSGVGGTEDPVGALISSVATATGSPTRETKRLFIDEFLGGGNTDIPILKTDTEDEDQPSSQMYHYVLCYATDPTPRELRGDWAEDTQKGVFHFHIGTNKGIVKRIKFEKTDQPFMREARYFGQGYGGLSQLREPYKITIDMYGNSKVFPGQTIFVDPSGLGYGLGQPNQGGGANGEPSKAWLLGLGGYHMIINVDHSIARGKFETTAKANWVFRGSPSGEITQGYPDGNPIRASAQCGAFGELTRPSGYRPPEGTETPSEGGDD